MSLTRRITDSSQLPTYDHHLVATPSAILTGPLQPVLDLADAIVANDAATLARFEVADRTTREEFIRHRLHAATLRGELAAVRAAVQELRAIQERPDRKLAEGLFDLIAVEACARPDPGAAAAQLAQEQLSQLPYDQVDDWLKSTFAVLATTNPDILIGRVRADLDRIAAKSGGRLDQDAAAQIVAARAAIDCHCRVAPQLAAAAQEVIAAHDVGEREDIWAARDVVLRPDWDALPTGVAVWDSGVDMSLFATTANPGLAMDGQGNRVDNLLRETGPYQDQIADLYALLKGRMDLTAGQMTAQAQAFQQKAAALKPEDVKAFTEALGFVANYTHGTHVAGIAVAGNPFARVQAISMHSPVRVEDFKLDHDISTRRAGFYGEAVATMKASGIRVTNMSWLLSAAYFETLLAAQGGVADAEARKRLAGELFALERKALLDAITGAPDILFVAGAGNAGNDASFAGYIPAGLVAPNLITVGAVDRSGREALFTSIGGTVALYANGVAVES
jgi:subtilisin family serine protease